MGSFQSDHWIDHEMVKIIDSGPALWPRMSNQSWMSCGWSAWQVAAEHPNPTAI
jgi:hypothetical protein